MRSLTVVIASSLLACMSPSPSPSLVGHVVPAPLRGGPVKVPGASDTAPAPSVSSRRERSAGRIADFILSLQEPGGAIRDEPGSYACNEDSNMEYALLGLAAAYRATGLRRYLHGFERGITWLAEREELADPQWAGSWYYVYSSRPPYQHLPTSPGRGIDDVRGVDTTSAYFAYLLYIDSRLPGNNDLAHRYAKHAQAGLDFVASRNWDAAGRASYSSWQLRDGRWRLWRYQYSSDQADVYLGMRAGAALYPEHRTRYSRYAADLARSLRQRFFDQRHRRYAEGLDGGHADWERGFDAVFPQGYVPWALSGTGHRKNMAAYRWLRAKQTSDGSVRAYRGDPGYALSASILAMAAVGTRSRQPRAAITWLLGGPYDRRTGAVRDTANPRAPEYANVAGLSVLALLRQRALAW